MLKTTLSTEAVLVDGKTENFHQTLRVNLVQSLAFEDGLKRSPIDLDIRSTTSLNLPRLQWTNYDQPSSKLKLVNTGNTVLLRGRWKDNERPSVSNGPLLSEHSFAQMHFHWHPFNNSDGSEHTVQGQRLPLELHAVHYRSGYQSLKMALEFNDALFVIGCFFQLQPEDNPGLAPLIAGLERIQEPDTGTSLPSFPLSAMLPEFSEDYLLYWGGVTPSEVICRMLWAMGRQAVGISQQQLSQFQQILCFSGKPMNSHYCKIHAKHERVVFHVNGSSDRRWTLLPLPAVGSGGSSNARRDVKPVENSRVLIDNGSSMKMLIRGDDVFVFNTVNDFDLTTAGGLMGEGKKGDGKIVEKKKWGGVDSNRRHDAALPESRNSDVGRKNNDYGFMSGVSMENCRSDKEVGTNFRERHKIGTKRTSMYFDLDVNENTASNELYDRALHDVGISLSLSPDQLICYLQPPDLGQGPEEVRAFPALEYHQHFDLEGRATLTNTQHCVELTLSDCSSPMLSGGPLHNGMEYVFVALHSYWLPNQYPTKFKPRGKKYEMEIHMLYYLRNTLTTDNNLTWPQGFAIVGFFVESGGKEENHYFAEYLLCLREVTSPRASCAASSRLLRMVRARAQPRGYLTRPGAFAAQPRADVVTWIFYPDPIRISHEQADEYRRLSQEARTKLSQSEDKSCHKKTVFRSV